MWILQNLAYMLNNIRINILLPQYVFHFDIYVFINELLH
jgi:hypothetical protein